MPAPLSNDLRRRIVEAREAGGSVRLVGERFGVAPSSVSNIHSLWRVTESVEPRKMGGDRRSHVIEAHHDWLLELVAETPDLTLAEIRLALNRRGHDFGKGAVWRFFERHRISFKKNRARRRAGSHGRRRGARAMAPATAEARPGQVDLPR